MIEPVCDLSPAGRALFDAIVDVRSPAEFAEDRIPGAINLPVLSDDERAEVGTIYKQESKFLARRIGAAHVARNVAGHLQGPLADKGPRFRPLLYCWRGGMRSNAMATILSQIGWRVGVLEGGYKTWRRTVIAALHEPGAPLKLVLLDGQTGAAKSEILRRVAAHGAQALDLEGLAAHRGSAFGTLPCTEQPTQKYFESQILDALSRLDPARPIVVEAESNRIGQLQIPARLWAAMRTAGRIEISAPAQTRAAYLVETYADAVAAPGAIESALEKLAPFHPKTRLEEWRGMAEAKNFWSLTEALIRFHYDPRYARARARRGDAPSAVIRLDRLDAEGFDATAAQIVALVESAVSQENA